MRPLLTFAVLALALSSVARAGTIDPFLYRDVRPGFCSIPETKTRLGQDDRDGALSLYLFASGNFAVAYEEHTPSCNPNKNECTYTTPVEIWVEGRWRESDGVIDLPGFGTARAEGNALAVTVTEMRTSPAARAQTFMAKPITSSVVAFTLLQKMKYRGFASTIPEVRDAIPSR